MSQSNSHPQENKPASPLYERGFGPAIRAGIASAKDNALPGFILWLFAMAVVSGFYLLPPIRVALEKLGSLKASGGFLYSALSTGLFGGIIPVLWRFARKRGSASPGFAPTLLFLFAFWAVKGIEIELLYGGLDRIFGSGLAANQIVPKVLADQFLYNPLWAGWTQIVAYWFLERSFKPAKGEFSLLVRSMGWRLVAILISTWAVWIPMVSVIYAMPANLQLPLFNIVLCFWSMMLASLTKEKK